MYLSVQNIQSEQSVRSVFIIYLVVEEITSLIMKTFSCDKCNKSYSSRQSLWKHRQKCKSIEKKDMLPTHSEKPCCSSFDKTKEKSSHSFVDKIIKS